MPLVGRDVPTSYETYVESGAGVGELEDGDGGSKPKSYEVRR